MDSWNNVLDSLENKFSDADSIYFVQNSGWVVNNQFQGFMLTLDQYREYVNLLLESSYSLQDFISSYYYTHKLDVRTKHREVNKQVGMIYTQKKGVLPVGRSALVFKGEQVAAVRLNNLPPLLTERDLR